MLFQKLALVAIVAGEVSMAAVSGDDSGSCASFPREEASLGEHSMLQQSSGAAPVSFGLHKEAGHADSPAKRQDKAKRVPAGEGAGAAAGLSVADKALAAVRAPAAQRLSPPAAARAGAGQPAGAGKPADVLVASAAPAAVDPPVPPLPQVPPPVPPRPEAARQAFLVNAAFDPTNVQDFLQSCEAVTPEVKAALTTEIKEYEHDIRFQMKISEAKGEILATAGHKAIVKYLRENVLEPDWSVLELGCAAGGMLRYVDDVYTQDKIGAHGSLVGVELVTGWVDFAKEYYPSAGKAIDVYEGDITEFALPEPHAGSTFDFVMLNDVMEHIQKKRYGCFFSQLDKVTHDGTIVYMHTPSPKAQLLDKDQYYENVVPHHLVVSGMAMIGFELVKFEYDMDTQCEKAQDEKLPRQLKGAGCYFNGWPKYTHNVYRKTGDKGVLNVS